MALVKNGRINIWNTVKKQFEVVHPETETARITDFADGIVQKLALTSAMTAVTALQTDSWFGKLLKMALTASGVKYNIAQNGYVCLGSLFGGLIIQWGTSDAITIRNDDHQVTQLFPVAVSTYLCGQATIFANKSSFNANEWRGDLMAHILNATLNSVTFLIDTASRDSSINISVEYVILAKSI